MSYYWKWFFFLLPLAIFFHLHLDSHWTGLTFLPPWTWLTNLHFSKLFTVLTASLLVCYKTGENIISQGWKSPRVNWELRVAWKQVKLVLQAPVTLLYLESAMFYIVSTLLSTMFLKCFLLVIDFIYMGWVRGLCWSTSLINAHIFTHTSRFTRYNVIVSEFCGLLN